MTYSQPQQPQYRPNRAALWVNDRKSAANQPDYKGNLEISWALLQELTAAFNAGQYAQDGGGQPCIKLDFALYAQQGGVSATGRARPILSGQLSTVTETQRSAAAKQQAAQQYAQPQAPAPVPQQPQYAQAQAPQYAPAGHSHASAQPQYAPAPQPQPQPAYQQPPQPQAPVPMAPVAPAPPMPGAIHGQPPAAPAGPAPVLPPGF